jgi:hypothetical protein
MKATLFCNPRFLPVRKTNRFYPNKIYMFSMKKILSISFVTVVFFACQNNKKDVVDDTCSTANVSYTGTIVPFINSHSCLSCHGGPSPLGGFNLETHAQVSAKAAEIRNGTSVLYGALSHMNGFTPMPQGLPQLSACELSKVKAWIDAGMPQ